MLGQRVPRLPNVGHSSGHMGAFNLLFVYNIKEAAKETGYTVNQLRERLAVLSAYLNGDLQRGPRNAILLSERGLDLLRKLASLEASGLSFTEALARLKNGAGADSPKPTLAENEQHLPKLSEVCPPSGEGSVTFAEGGQRCPNMDLEVELIRILWTLTAILGLGVATLAGLGVAALLTR